MYDYESSKIQSHRYKFTKSCFSGDECREGYQQYWKNQVFFQLDTAGEDILLAWVVGKALEGICWRAVACKEILFAEVSGPKNLPNSE